jgi:Fe-S-cluster-containing hydrogenase component 2
MKGDTKIIDLKVLKKSAGYPSNKRMMKGPVAVLECIEEIPCNPCEEICPFEAITIDRPITNKKVLLEDQCTGCMKCIAICPGQAIFVVDKSYSEDEGTVSLPYEFLPIPKVSDRVQALDRSGKILCESEVISVTEPNRYHTYIVTIMVPKKHVENARFIKIS